MYIIKRYVDRLTPGTQDSLSEYSQSEIDTMLKNGQVERVEIAPQGAKPEPVEAVDLSSYTVVELKEMAAAAGVVGYSTMRKGELIEALG